MAGTATDYNVTKVAVGHGQLWTGLAIPGANARLTLFSDGTPDATANPSAKHLGMTESGSELKIVPKMTTYEADEIAFPILTNVDGSEATLTGSLLQVYDMVLAAKLLPGVGTRSTAAGYDQVQIGTKAMTYESLALIFPTQNDPTKFAVFHMYNCYNDAGLALQVGRKMMAKTPFAFKGLAIPSRAATDNVCNYWIQIA